MVETFELAVAKVAELPEAEQEQLVRELLERIETLNRLRTDIGVGVGALDTGLGRDLNIENVIAQVQEDLHEEADDLIRQIQEEYAKGVQDGSKLAQDEQAKYA